MSPASPRDESTIRPHPLARALLARLASQQPRLPVLDFAAGSGRNGAALRAAGFDVSAIDDRRAESPGALDDAGTFGAVVSTHGFLHGGPGAIAQRVRAVAEHLGSGGLLYATFASTRDARFGSGKPLGPRTYAPVEGDECGVAHTFFDETSLRSLLEPSFDVETLEERNVGAIRGAWAHRQPHGGAVHWFVVARRRATAE